MPTGPWRCSAQRRRTQPPPEPDPTAAATVLAMAERTEVSTDIAAPTDQVWGLVSDLTQMGRWSPENEGVEWLAGATGPVVGAKFKGSNRHGAKSWSTQGTITEATPSKALAFRITAGPFKVAEWRYEFEAVDGGCRVTESTIDQRSGLAKFLGKLATGIDDRATHNRATMAQTLAALKAAAESASSSG
jgi:uncharacterized protein YndB with AHSA1/START domain